MNDGQRLFEAISGLTKTVEILQNDVGARLTTLETRFIIFEATVDRRFEERQDRMNAELDHH